MELNRLRVLEGDDDLEVVGPQHESRNIFASAKRKQSCFRNQAPDREVWYLARHVVEVLSECAGSLSTEPVSRLSETADETLWAELASRYAPESGRVRYSNATGS